MKIEKIEKSTDYLTKLLFPKPWQVQVFDICFGCPMHEAYLTSKKEVTSSHWANTLKATPFSLFSQTLTKYLSFNPLTHDETNMFHCQAESIYIWLLRRRWQLVTQQTQQTHCTVLFVGFSNVVKYQKCPNIEVILMVMRKVKLWLFWWLWWKQWTWRKRYLVNHHLWLWSEIILNQIVDCGGQTTRT